MNRTEMRRCGKRYATLEAAQRSKAGGREGAESGACQFGCGGFHVKKPPSVPRPARADRPRSPRGSVQAAVRLVLGGHLAVGRAALIYGASPESVEVATWAAAQQLVRDRDSYTCLSCGHAGTDVHHRVRRGIGGTADPVIAFGRTNLLLLCRECHDRCHAEDPEMRARGFWLRTGQKAAEEPVYALAEYGCERLWLLPDGGASRTGPYEEVAA